MNVSTITQKSLRVGVASIALSCIAVWAAGCGASRQSTNYDDDEINIDELLSEEGTRAQGQQDQEAEVLRLLGITPSNNQPTETTTTAAPEERAAGNLEGEVGELQQELEQKEEQIASLRAELIRKESKISELEEKLESGPTTRTVTPTGGDFKSRYQQALNLFNSRNYQQALNQFSELLALDANNSLSDNCQYWIGECRYALGNYHQAIAEFEKVFSFPNSNKSDDAQLKLGICYMKLGDRAQAIAEFERLLANYPDSEYVSLAQRYLQRLR